MEEELKRRRKYKWLGIIALIIVGLISAFFIIANIATRSKIELSDVHHEFVARDRIQVTVTAENTGDADLIVTLKFSSKWNGEKDSQTKEVLVPAHESVKATATLRANPAYGGETKYSVKVISEKKAK